MGIVRRAVSACSLALLVFAGGATGVEAAWTSSPQSVTAGPENVLSLQAAPGADGTTSLVWDDYLASSGENTIHLTRIPLGGTPGTPVQLDTGPEDALYPKLAAGADGHSSLVWSTTSGEPDYLAQISPSGQVLRCSCRFTARRRRLRSTRTRSLRQPGPKETPSSSSASRPKESPTRP